MRSQKIISFVACLWLLFCCAPISYASHIRAGDMTAVRIGSLTYRFQITLYTLRGANVESDRLKINFGDGSPEGEITRCGNKRDIGNDTDVGYYGFDGINVGTCAVLSHTYPGAGIYTVTFVENNRIEGVNNMANSVNTPFSISVTIVITPVLGANTSPIMTVAPIDLACGGQKFFHNPGAYDPDGDSLVFKLTTPRQSATQTVLDYRSPETFSSVKEDGTAPPIFAIDPRTGDLTWDAPSNSKLGIYNIAFVVEEYRNGIKIGQVVRDMQIIVKDCNNKRPKLVVPDVCIVADDDPATNSNIIQRDITATDGDVPPNSLVISSESRQQVYSGFGSNGATFVFNPNPQPSPALGTFTWNTKAEHVQRQPYIVVFKVTDIVTSPKIPLIDIQSMLITVKGTPVRNVTVTPSGKKMNLAWSDYKALCPTFTSAQFDKMQYVIWRREGCGSTIACDKNPANEGYTAIGTVGLNTTNFVDNGALRIGLSYSYVITVKYPETRGGESQASVEVCASLPIETPIITQVSVKSTHAATGEVGLTWLRPMPKLDLTAFNAKFPKPYRYELYRAEGFSSTAYTLVTTQNDADGSITEFTHADAGLNTQDKIFLYKVVWYTQAGTAGESKMQASDSSSTVRLTATPRLNAIELAWDYNTAWSNQNFIHEVFRGEEGQPKTAYVKIGEQLVGERKFVDNGSYLNICLDPLKKYGYYIRTKGSYSNPTVIPEPLDLLRNDSQQAYASPLDNTPPPPPILSIDTTKCPAKPDCNTPIQTVEAKNKLTWQPVKGGDKCQDFIATYRLYFKPAGSDAFVLLTPPTFPQPYLDTFYTHTDLPTTRTGARSQAGCYYVTAVDQQNNESAPSNIVCQDNCLYFKLPNVFTPGVDGKNDTFKACPTPQYVDKVTFSVYNRWGGLIYRGDSDVEVNWNGKDNNGQDVPAGTYYYEAKVEFVTIDESKRVQSFKGWVSLVR